MRPASTFSIIQLSNSRKNPVMISGVNTYDGKLTCKNVAESFQMEYTDLQSLL